MLSALKGDSQLSLFYYALTGKLKNSTVLYCLPWNCSVPLGFSHFE